MCEKNCPGKIFRIMEYSNKPGGKAFPNITHQTILIIIFMTPLMKKGSQYKPLYRMCIWRYILNFNPNGKAKLNNRVEIDFNSMAKNLISIETYARNNGLRIKKVIFKINLKDELFNSEYGNQLKNKNIYFVKRLSCKIDKLRDDHYHVDFAVIK